MAANGRRIPDSTADAAIGDLSGESILVEVFGRIGNPEDRALLFAHVALEIPLHSLERQSSMSRRELSRRIRAILDGLRQDAELAALLSGIHRAGRIEHYQALIVSLGLEDWFCAYCGHFMVQPRTGRPRKTCTDKCRLERWKENRQR